MPADFNSIGRSQLAGAVGRLYGVRDPRLDVLGAELQVTTSPWERPEFWALLGGSLGMGAGTSAASGGAPPSQVALQNPVGSGVLGLIERIIINNVNPAVGYFSVILVNVSLFSSTGAWVNRDLRRAQTAGGSGSLAMRIRTDNTSTVAAASLLAEILIPGSSHKDLELDYVLPPGWGVMVRAGPMVTPVANQEMRATFIGRERPAPDPELNNL